MKGLSVMSIFSKPTYSPTQAQALRFGSEDEINAAVSWIQTDGSDFAASIRDRFTRDGALTERQWAACIAGARGLYVRIKPRKSPIPAVPKAALTPAATTPAATGDAPKARKPRKPRAPKTAPAQTTEPVHPDPIPSFVRGAPPKVDNPRKPLTPAQRSYLADHITALGRYVPDQEQDTLYHLADLYGIDVAALLDKQAADLRKAAQSAFNAVSAKSPATGFTDWQRIREIAREEIALRLDPVKQTVLIVDRAGSQVSLANDLMHPEFEKLVRSVTVRDFTSQRLNVLLVGPTGTGKSYACRQVAKALSLPFFFQSQADESFALVGYERVNGTMKYTPFVEAFRDGGVCLLDELDRYSPKALTALNAALANGAMTLDNGEVIKRHTDFVCIGAANTMGMGGSSDFTAAEKLDLSTISRFSVRLDWHVCTDTESAIAEAKSDNASHATTWLTEIRKARQAFERLGLPYLADQRAIEAGANLLAAGLSIQEVRSITYLAPLDSDQRAAILNLI